jgi:hypothetical protein
MFFENIVKFDQFYRVFLLKIQSDPELPVFGMIFFRIRILLNWKFRIRPDPVHNTDRK